MLFSKKGNEDSVSGFTKAQIERMRGGVLTHNHPNGSCFSLADLNTFRLRGLSEIRACNQDGAYVLRLIDKWPKELSSRKKLEEAYNDIEDQVYNRFRDLAAQNGKLIIYYLNEADSETMKQFSKKYGLKFFFEKEEDLLS